MLRIIEIVAQYVSWLAEAVAALVILIGTIQSLWKYLQKIFHIKTACQQSCRSIVQSRIILGHTLSLSLEFLIGADIIKTAIAPTWTDIGQLSAIVGIRTVLNFFLMRELEHEQNIISQSYSFSESTTADDKLNDPGDN